MLESASAYGPAKIVDLRQYRLLRLMQEAGRQQQEVAEMMRESATDRARIAESLKGAQHRRKLHDPAGPAGAGAGFP